MCQNTGKAKRGVSAPSENEKYGDLQKLINKFQKKHVDENPPKMLDHELTEQEIIEKIGGGDMTKGSCASLALAYAGNKAGYDVRDFRGGNSLDVVAENMSDTLKQSKSAAVNYASTAGEKVKFIKSLPEGQEYVFGTGKHMTVVKQVGGKAYYLELQNPHGVKNPSGWGTFRNGWEHLKSGTDLSLRFGKSVDTSGFVAISVEDIAKVKGFKKALGYINTQKNKEMKGSSGRAK